MLLVIGYPVYYTIYLSFFNTPPSLAMEPEDLCWAWIITCVSLPARRFAKSTCNTLIWTMFSTLFSFVLGFGAALALNREFLGRGLMRGILLVPYVISGVSASYIWRWIYHSDFGVIGAIRWHWASPTGR